MPLKLFHMGFVPFITLFLTVSSLVLDRPPSPPLLVISAVLLVGCSVLLLRFPFLRYARFPLLGLFHWSSHLNWTSILYYIFIVMVMYRRPRFVPSILVSLGALLEFTAIRLSYQPLTSANLLVSVNDLIGAALIVLFARHVLHTEEEKRRLAEQNAYLATHDPLTGLLNYEGYLRKLQELVAREQPFALVAIDLRDFKSFNAPNAHNGNGILTSVAGTLKKLFKHAHALSRYAGDRFAVILPDTPELAAETEQLLAYHQLGFDVTYAVSRFPQEAATAPVLITLTEDRLFQNKRNLWVLEEEIRFQEEKLKVVGELAAGMAHEIRNPLTTVRGFMQLAQTNQYSVKPWYDLIMSEVTRMSELTAEFLQFAKPHISNMKPERIIVCVERVLFLTESEAALQGHVIVREGTDEDMLILVDRDKMVQVLLNLMRNAFEAMRESGTVRVRCYRQDRHGLIEVADSGSGIPEEEQGKIFNPFYTTKDNGTGLGLSICRKIIQDHGGSIALRSLPGEGSVFTIRLPLLET